jgi:hypothetical protein
VVDAVASSVRIQSVYSICAVVRRIVFMLRGCLCPFDIKLGSHRQKLRSWSNTLGYCRSRRIILYLFKELRYCLRLVLQLLYCTVHVSVSKSQHPITIAMAKVHI